MACVWALIKEGIPLAIGLSITFAVSIAATVYMHVSCKSW
jgi:hypothetical protein